MRIPLFALIVCLLPGCVDYTEGLCVPHVDTFCYQDQTYWLDSCDRLENVLQECECGCRADQYGCRICGEKECEDDNDCPQGYLCDRSDWLCKPRECIPECEDKCCGPDGCGGNCPTSCPRGQECNAVTCQCETHCRSDADCRPNQCCHQGLCAVMTCGTLECGPDPTCGKECGPCSYPLECDHGVCVEVYYCTTDGQCMPGECCRDGMCTLPDCQWQECGPDPVCGFECGPCPAGLYCDNGACHGGGDLCPPGQECVDATGTGYLKCLIPPASIPPNNPTGCAAVGYCDGNFACHCVTETCSESACIENCGSCPADLICVELWENGLWGCLTPDWQLPPNPPYCDQNTPCQGNSICYTDGTNNFCLENCSSSGGTTCTDGEMVCYGPYLSMCQNGTWQEVADCSDTNQVCYNQACVDPARLGEFCGALPCATGLECLATPNSQNGFCTNPCTCGDVAGCLAGWSCMLTDNTRCWCGVECNTASDCPNGGMGWDCVYLGVDEQGQNIYGCLPL